MALADTATVCSGGVAWPRGAQDEAAWQAAILAAELAALGIREAPSEAELWGLTPDPGSDPPDDAEADIPSDVLIAQALTARAEAAAKAAERPELFPPGMLRCHRSARGVAFGDGAASLQDPAFGDGAVFGLEPALAQGPAFGHGGVLDAAEPGPVLAGFASDAWTGGLDRLDDDQLIGVVRAWRRLSSWAAAGELAAVGELVTRRESDRDVRPYGDPLASVTDELACALTLTGRGADALVDRAVGLRALSATGAALARSRIDMPKALTIIDGVTGLDRQLALAVEEKVLPNAPVQTTGELRAAVRRAVLA